MLEDGARAVLHREGVVIDTVDLTLFDLTVVGQDSLVFLAVRTDSVPITTPTQSWHESSPTEHVFWTPQSRRELRDILPFFFASSSSPIVHGSVIYYWGIAPRNPTNRLYAMRYDFRTAHLDSVFLNREDPLATDYRYHLNTPQVHASDVSFAGVVVDGATWQVIRQNPGPQ
jgi:hypothetical protein